MLQKEAVKLDPRRDRYLRDNQREVLMADEGRIPFGEQRGSEHSPLKQ